MSDTPGKETPGKETPGDETSGKARAGEERAGEEKAGKETHAGGSAGRSVPPLPPDEQPSEEDLGGHEGDIEIGIGMPVSAEDYRALKREARRLDTTSDAVDGNRDSAESDKE